MRSARRLYLDSEETRLQVWRASDGTKARSVDAMSGHSRRRPGSAVVIFFDRISLCLYLLLAVLVMALTLWFAWMHPSTLANSVAETLGCASFTWLNVSILQIHRGARKLDLSPSDVTALFGGPRPDDPDKARIWRWGWQFLVAVFAVLLSMAGSVVTR